MKKEQQTKKFKRYIKERKKSKVPICFTCYKKMVKDTDPITKRKSKYIWKTNCKHTKDLRLMTA